VREIALILIAIFAEIGMGATVVWFWRHRNDGSAAPDLFRPR